MSGIYNDLLSLYYGGGVEEELEDDNTERTQIPLRNEKKTREIMGRLLEALRETTIPTIGKDSGRGGTIGTIGRTITFGFGNTRRGYKEFVKNKEHPELLRLLAEFGNSVVPKGWEYNAITLNEGVKANKHKDSKNIGQSVIIGIGDYTGGDVRVWDKDDKNPISFNIKLRPTMFNGGLLYHQTAPFKGERYTMIFYKQHPTGKVKGVRMEGSGVFA
jgi:hypothetical protein